HRPQNDFRISASKRNAVHWALWGVVIFLYGRGASGRHGRGPRGTAPASRRPLSSVASSVIHLITLLEFGGAQGNTLHTVAHLDPKRFDARLWCGRGA